MGGEVNMTTHITTEKLSLPDALYRLLYHRSYRQAFLDGRYDDLHLSPEDLDHLMIIDKEELEMTALRILRNIANGNSEAGGGLRAAYPNVLQGLERMGRSADDVLYAFLESDEFEQYREVPFAGLGVCVEEAFYRFLLHDESFLQQPYHADLLTHEFLTALLSILVVNKNPNFAVRTERVHQHVEHDPPGQLHYAVQTYDAEFLARLTGKPAADPQAKVLWLYAATAKTLVKGQISELTRDLLACGSRRVLQEKIDDLASAYALSPAQVQASANNLHSMGLLL